MAETGHQLLRQQELSSPSTLREAAQQVLSCGKMYAIVECDDGAHILVVSDKQVNTDLMGYSIGQFHKVYNEQIRKAPHGN